MRKLAAAAFSFAAAQALFYYLLPVSLGPVCAGVSALAFLAALLLRGDARVRAALIAAGLCVGSLWSWGYDRLFLAGAESLSARTVTVDARVLDYPEERDYGARVDMRVMLSGPDATATVFFFEELPYLSPGDTVHMKAEFVRPSDVFDGGNEIYARRGTSLFAYAQQGWSAEHGFSLRYLPRRAAKVLGDRLREIFPRDVRGFMSALLLGDRTELYEDEIAVQAMSRSGISHVVAVSGMHLAFLMQFLTLLTRRKKVLAAVGIPGVLFFMAMTGFTPSVARAGIMQLFVLTAYLLKREADPLTSLAASLLILLGLNPRAVGSPALQLSFAATLGLILVSPHLFERAYAHVPKKLKTKKLPRGVIVAILSGVCSTVGALLLTVPLSAAHFGYVSVVSPVVNLIISWPVSAAFVGGYIVTLLGMLCPPLGAACASVLSVLPRFILGAARFFAALSVSSVSTGDPFVLAWLIYVYALLAVLLIIRPRIRQLLVPGALAVVSFCLVILITQLRPAVSGEMEFTVLDVGQGQCCIAEMYGAAVVVDCGSTSQEDAGRVAADAIYGSGETAVDLLVLTHYHADHVNGVAELMARVPVAAVALPEPAEEDAEAAGRILALAERQKADIIVVTEDMTLDVGEGQVTLFAPVGDATYENERGICILLTDGDYDVLITGDAGMETEIILARTKDLPDIETLVVGHHGSHYSTSVTLLNAVTPETAIVSVGEDNPYGHPSPDVLERLDSFGITIYRTDRNGTVTVRAG